MTASDRELSHRQELIKANTDSLRQAVRLLAALDERTYKESPSGFAPHRVGGHVRHILEFYECLLEGVASGCVDYDARKRDAGVESNLSLAKTRIQQIISRLESTPSLQSDSRIAVRMEDMPDGFVWSSLGRELQVLSSHTIHHFALIAVTLTAHGVAIEPDFGMAPSTLRYLASRQDAA